MRKCRDCGSHLCCMVSETDLDHPLSRWAEPIIFLILAALVAWPIYGALCMLF